MILLLKNALFTLLIPGTVTVYIPLQLVRGRSADSPAAFALGLILMACGAAIYLWCLWDFASFGRGTPAPIDAPKMLVARGLYRRCRNPMYVGLLFVILGWAAIYQTLSLAGYALAVAAGFHLNVVLFEERRLTKKFGSEYLAYCARTPRWPYRFWRPPAAE